MSHYTGTPGFFQNAFRSIISVLDGVVYTIIVQIYKLFFAVSTSTIIDGDVARKFYQRIQLILGIFMIFKLAISLLNLIIEPDSIKDKNAGAGKIVVRVIISLLMLTAVVPLNIPNAQPRTLNGYINDHGILFGALYAVQDRVLSENIIAKLLLGYQTGDSDVTTDSSEVPDTSLGTNFEGMGQLLASTILRSFILVNVKDDTAETLEEDNVYCPAEVASSGYGEEDLAVGSILSEDVINATCESNGKKYAFHYLAVFSTVVGVVVAILLLGYTIDVAIRAIKIVILRIIAPIPIISYVDPKSSKDGAFGAWTKTLASTYLDLFIRLAIIYFGIFVIASIAQNGVSGIRLADNASGLLKAMTLVFIILGILFFMRQAPNFIRTMLGSKNPLSNVGLSAMLGGIGTLRGGGSPLDALSSAYEAGTTNLNGGKSLPPSAYNSARDNQIKKAREDYGRNLQQEYYKRGLDIDAAADGLRDGQHAPFFSNSKARGAYSNQTMLDNNIQRYRAQAQNYALAEGRGNTVRPGMNPWPITDASDGSTTTAPSTVVAPATSGAVPTNPQTASTTSNSNPETLADRIMNQYSEPNSYEEHQRLQGEYTDLFMSPTGQAYLDANEQVYQARQRRPKVDKVSGGIITDSGIILGGSVEQTRRNSNSSNGSNNMNNNNNNNNNNQMS